MSQKIDRGEASLLTTIKVMFIVFGLLIYMTLMLCANGLHKYCICSLIMLAEEVKCDCWGRFQHFKISTKNSV